MQGKIVYHQNLGGSNVKLNKNNRRKRRDASSLLPETLTLAAATVGGAVVLAARDLVDVGSSSRGGEEELACERTRDHSLWRGRGEPSPGAPGCRG